MKDITPQLGGIIMTTPFIPEGFDTKDGTVIETQEIAIPGADHPHYVITLQTTVNDAERELARELNGVYSPIVEAMPEGETRDEAATVLQKLRDVIDAEHMYHVVGYCEPGGAQQFDASPTLTGAQEVALQLRAVAEGIEA